MKVYFNCINLLQYQHKITLQWWLIIGVNLTLSRDCIVRRVCSLVPRPLPDFISQPFFSTAAK